MSHKATSKSEMRKLEVRSDADIPGFVRYMLGLSPDSPPDSECTLNKIPADYYANAVKALEHKREVLKKAK